MSDNRSKWSYFDEDDIERIDESVTIQNKVWAKTAASIKSRDPNARPAPVQPRTNGWLNEVPYGDEFNYILKQMATMLAELEARGIMFWSALTNYTLPTTVWGSDNTRYAALLPSGPSYGGAKDPIEEPNYWFPKDLITTSRKSIDGYLIARDPLDYKLRISAGQARSANIDLITDINLTSTLVKRVDAEWAEGPNIGGLFAGAYPAVADTWYHVFAIKNTNTGAVDVGFDTSPFAIHRPFGLGWTAYRRIGSFKTDPVTSTTIVPFTACEFAGGAIEYRWKTRVFEFSFVPTTPPTTRTLRVISVPPDILPIAKMSATLRSNVTITVLITSPFDTDSEPHPETFSNAHTEAGAVYSVAYFDVLADSVSQIGWRQVGGPGLVAGSLNTIGWVDRRVDVEES